MERTTETILVIDDDRDLCELLTEYLMPEGYDVEAAYDGEKGLALALSRKYGLVVLDVMLPGMHGGFDVLRKLRARVGTPILMLTARGDDVDRIVGLEMGADDYLSKPFNPRELLARIRAILRRAKPGAQEITTGMESAKYKVGDVEVYQGTRTVLRGGEFVQLTAVEFSLLEMLLLNAGRIVMRDELTREVLGRSLSPYDRSIDVHVSKLRKKLGPENSGTERIKSIRGSGYLYTLPHLPGREPDGRSEDGEEKEGR
jgi:DNA-binding response OmpR family regulator